MTFKYHYGGHVESRYWQLVDSAPTSEAIHSLCGRFQKALTRQLKRVQNDFSVNHETRDRRTRFLEIALRFVGNRTNIRLAELKYALDCLEAE
jgi:hypothetical protein